jgi:hypothetical protein
VSLRVSGDCGLGNSSLIFGREPNLSSFFIGKVTTPNCYPSRSATLILRPKWDRAYLQF